MGSVTVAAMRWDFVAVPLMGLAVDLAACKPKPDPVCRAAQSRVGSCPKSTRDTWTQEHLSECIHDVRKASNANVLQACVELPDCDAARVCVGAALTSAARK